MEWLSSLERVVKLMNKKISIGAAVSLMALTAAVSITLTALLVMNSLNGRLASLTQRTALLQKLTAVDSLVREKYVGNLDSTALIDDTIAGYIKGTGDKYGAYLDAEDYSALEQRTSGEGLGIGVNVVSGSDGTIRVVSVISGSPAQKAGVKVGDEITSIGGQDVKTTGYASAVNLLKGSEGSTVQFNVLRGSMTLPFSVVRQKYTLESVQSRRIGNLGYVRIVEFDANTADQFSKQVDSLIAGGAKGLVFDVRNNPGGRVDAAAKMIDKLVPAGPIVRAKYRTGAIQTLYTSDAKQVNLPMVVLQNGDTASAAELFTAALRDYGKAKSVGTKTYGKGTMQEFLSLHDGTALDLSVAYFYPPKSDNFEGVGLQPDIPSELSAAAQQNQYDLSMDDDTQLQTAISTVELQIK